MPERSPRLRRILTVSGGMLLSCLFVEALLRYAALSTYVFDLGLFLNSFYNVGKEWQRAFWGHIHPFIPLYGLIYAHLPAGMAPYFVVGEQALALIIATVWMWRSFGAWPGMAMAIYYPLWVNALFDFHFDHLAIPLLAWFYIACQKRRFGQAMSAAISLILVKEPFALETAGCGIYLLWLTLRENGLQDRCRIWGSLWVIIVGMSWFYISVNWLLPYFTVGALRGGIDASAFSWLGHNLKDMVITLLIRPDLIPREIFQTPGKLAYLVVIFGSLAFIPLLRPAALIPALPILLISLLSHLSNYYSYSNHYTAGIIVPAIVAFRDGLPVAGRWFEVIWGRLTTRFAIPNRRTDYGGMTFAVLLIGWMLISHAALATSPISRLFWSDKICNYNWRAYVPTARDAMMKQAMRSCIPVNPNMVVSTQNSVNWGYLTRCQACLPFPEGIRKPHLTPDWSNRTVSGLWQFVMTGHQTPVKVKPRFADFVVLDLKRPWTLTDQGCDWLYGRCTNTEMAERFLHQIDTMSIDYQNIFSQDGFMIFRRKTDMQ